MICIELIKISKLKIFCNNTLEFIVVTNVRFVMHYDSNLTNVEIYITVQDLVHFSMIYISDFSRMLICIQV